MNPNIIFLACKARPGWVGAELVKMEQWALIITEHGKNAIDAYEHWCNNNVTSQRLYDNLLTISDGYVLVSRVGTIDEWVFNWNDTFVRKITTTELQFMLSQHLVCLVCMSATTSDLFQMGLDWLGALDQKRIY